MKKRHAVLIGLIVISLGYLFYSYKDYKQQILHVLDAPSKYTITRAGADLRVVNFNSPECMGCRKIYPIIKDAVERDGNVVYIPRIISMGNAWHDEIYIAIYAAAEQGLFEPMFNLIYQRWPIDDKTQLLNYAQEIGLDTIQLEEDMQKPEIRAYLDQNMEYFEAWYLRGTPSIIIGSDTVYQPGREDPDVSLFLDGFQSARDKNKR